MFYYIRIRNLNGLQVLIIRIRLQVNDRAEGIFQGLLLVGQLELDACLLSCRLCCFPFWECKCRVAPLPHATFSS